MEDCGCDETYCDNHFEEAKKEYSYLKNVSKEWVLSPERIAELEK